MFSDKLLYKVVSHLSVLGGISLALNNGLIVFYFMQSHT